MGFIIRMAITAVGLWIASRLLDGLVIEDERTLVFAALLLGVVNAFVRPIVVFMTFPITLLTLGLFLFVVNAGMLALVAWMLEGFHIAGLGSALIGWIIVGLTSWIGSGFIGARGVERLSD